MVVPVPDDRQGNHNLGRHFLCSYALGQLAGQAHQAAVLRAEHHIVAHIPIVDFHAVDHPAGGLRQFDIRYDPASCKGFCAFLGVLLADAFMGQLGQLGAGGLQVVRQAAGGGVQARFVEIPFPLKHHQVIQLALAFGLYKNGGDVGLREALQDDVAHSGFFHFNGFRAGLIRGLHADTGHIQGHFVEGHLVLVVLLVLVGQLQLLAVLAG